MPLELNFSNRESRSSRLWWLVFFIAIMAVILGIIGLYKYENEHSDTVDFGNILYHTLQMFILHTPHFEGGVNWAMEAARWLAASASLLAVWVTLVRIFREEVRLLWLFRIKKHIVICGMGRNGRIIYDHVKKDRIRNQKIVIIDKDISNPYSEKLDKDPNTLWIRKDFTKSPVLRGAKLKKSAKIYITTNLDMDNVNTMVNVINIINENKKPHWFSRMVTLYKSGEPLKDIKAKNNHTEKKVDEIKSPLIFCHIGDFVLHDNLKETILKEDAYSQVTMFNGYKSATATLYNDFLQGRNYISSEKNIFIFFGFGRFGQMLFNQVVEQSENNKNDEILIITLAESLISDKRNFTNSPEKLENFVYHEPIIGDMNNRSIWDKVNDIIESDTKKALIFNCRDSDVANFNLALSLKRKGPKALKDAVFFCRIYGTISKEIDAIFKSHIVEGGENDIITFQVHKELETAFINSKLFE